MFAKGPSRGPVADTPTYVSIFLSFSLFINNTEAVRARRRVENCIIIMALEMSQGSIRKHGEYKNITVYKNRDTYYFIYINYEKKTQQRILKI